MLHNKLLLGTFLTSVSFFILSGCYKDKTVIFNTPAAEVTRTVTFNDDIQPIFKNSCALSGCHVSGGPAPDLTPDKAYNSLTNSDLIIPGNADGSEFYGWVSGKEASPMPMGGVNKDYAALIYAWIKQGALNN